MKIIRCALCLCLCLCFCCLLCTGCGSDYQDAILYYELPDKPETLDPQIASSDAECSLVRNIFEGLLRKNAQGTVVPGAAEQYEKNGAVYTFHLRDNLIWSDQQPLTAADFVFGLRRALDPKTKAPFAFRLFCIENAEKIHAGKADLSTLGVSAPDDRTVVIRLAYEDAYFENTLTTSVAMPCREDFFNNAAGKYGLESEFILSNGSYRLTKWNKESFGIRLYKNMGYQGDFPAKNAAVYVTKDEKKSAFDRLADNNVDIAFFDVSLDDEAKKQGLKTVQFENICWMLTIGSDFSERLRQSLAMLVGGEAFAANLPAGYRMADSLYPAILSDAAAGEGSTLYNPEEARRIFSEEINRLPEKKFPSGIKLRYESSETIKPVVTDLVGHWQNKLGAFVNIDAVKPGELSDQLTGQTLPIAFFPVTARNGNCAEYLRHFGYTQNHADPAQAQKDLLKSTHLIPVVFAKTEIGFSAALNEVFIEPENGYIDFSMIVKKG